MQTSYHFALTKIQKLQQQKKKLFSVPADIARNWPLHGRYLNQYEILVFRYRYTYQYSKY